MNKLNPACDFFRPLICLTFLTGLAAPFSSQTKPDAILDLLSNQNLAVHFYFGGIYSCVTKRICCNNFNFGAKLSFFF